MPWAAGKGGATWQTVGPLVQFGSTAFFLKGAGGRYTTDQDMVGGRLLFFFLNSEKSILLRYYCVLVSHHMYIYIIIIFNIVN